MGKDEEAMREKRERNKVLEGKKRDGVFGYALAMKRYINEIFHTMEKLLWRQTERDRQRETERQTLRKTRQS